MMNVGRCRNAGKREVSSWVDSSFHDISCFRGVTFVGPIIANGGFEETITLDSEALVKKQGSGTWRFGNTPPRVPKGWSLHYAGGKLATVLTDGAYAGKQAWQIEGGIILNRMEVAMKAGLALTLSFAARGTGTIKVSVYHYDTNGLFTVTQLGDVNLNSTPELQWNRYSFPYAHPADYPPAATLALGVRERAEIDDVRAKPVAPDQADSADQDAAGRL